MKSLPAPEHIPGRIKALAMENYQAMVALRRFFHAHPETAFQEYETSLKIRAELNKLKIKAVSLAGTGIVGLLRGRQAGPVCAVRSDIDALPIFEKTKLPFRSKTPGKMHACGHDLHMATVLGTAMILCALKSRLNGTVKFIFQPAEEEPPGGAAEMIKAGVLKNPAVKMILALHTDPNLPTGKIGIKEGVMMAEVLDFNISIFGKSGHGARPHNAIDSILIASQIVASLQSVVSRGLDPREAAVLTIGEIRGGTARNVIAGETALKGTIRGLKSETISRAKIILERMVAGICEAASARHKIDFIADYPMLENNSAANSIVRETAYSLYGKKSVIELPSADMGGEDFARYLKHSQGAMFRLGVRNSRVGAIYQWHSDRFNADERAMVIGSAILAGAVIKYLESRG